MIELRRYQHRAIADLRSAYASGARAPVLVLPCGGGKTLIAAEIIRAAVAKSKRALFLAHRVELIEQTIDKLASTGVTDVRMIRAEHDIGAPSAPVTVASVPTLSTPRWLENLPAADLVVIDECHHTRAATWSRLASAYPRLLGMTATPERGDGRALGDIFDSLVIGSTVTELTSLGYLVPCRLFAPTQISRQLALTPLEAYTQYANGERAVVFCLTVEHARLVAREMSEAGVATEVVYGEMSGRADTLARFRSGEIRAIANVNVLVEGWDDPGASVAILARKFGHVGTYIQAIGRVLRPSPGKAGAVVVDLCGSALEHGTPDTAREYSLDGKGMSTSTRIPIRQCPSCGGVFVGGSACPMCGLAMPSIERDLPQSNGMGVTEVIPTTIRKPWVVRCKAKFAGRCARCPRRIAVGEQIVWSKGSKPIHVECK